MDKCLEYTPWNSFPWFRRLLLIFLLTFSAPVISIAIYLHIITSFHCYSDITKAKEALFIKSIESNCLRQYKDEVTFYDSIHLVICLNLALIMLLKLLYGYFVKYQVKQCGQLNLKSRINKDNEALLARNDQDSPYSSRLVRRLSTYFIYIAKLALLFVMLSVFVVIFLPAKFPVDYTCYWHFQMKEIYSLNKPTTSYNVTLYNCVNINGRKSEILIKIVAYFDVIVLILTALELCYLAYVGCTDSFFLTDREFCTVYLLRKRERFRKWLRKIKYNFYTYKLFEVYDDYGDNQKIWRKLDDIYVNIIMQAERQQKNAHPTNFGRHSILKSYLEIHGDANRLTRAAEIFKSIHSEQNHLPKRSVLVVGRPGIGKTMLTKKLMYEWKKNTDEYWHEKLVLLMRCRTFKEDDITLREMLGNCSGLLDQQFSQIYDFVLLNSDKTVLIFDGLDELPLDDEHFTAEGSVCADAKMSAFALLSMLIEGRLLPGVTVLVTSRPTAQHAFEMLKFKRTVEILGFFEDQIKEYVSKFCFNDERTATAIFDCISCSLELRSLCYIPVNCYIVCLTLKECFINNTENIPKTITELYKRAVQILLLRHHPRCISESTPNPNNGSLIQPFPNEVNNELEKIKSLAKEGIDERKFIFDGTNLAQFPKLTDCGLFHQIPDKQRNLYCFLHLTLQEFLAAWCIVDREDIGKFLDDHVAHPKWHLMIEFVAGLVGVMKRERKIENINDFQKRLETWATYLTFNDGDRTLSLLGVRCLFEMQDTDATRSACMTLENSISNDAEIVIDDVSFTPVDANALFEFLSQCRRITKLRFNFCKWLVNHSCLRMKSFLSNMETLNLTSLSLFACTFTESVWEHLGEALTSDKCKLTELYISYSNLKDQGVKYLSEALRNNNCQLSGLYIRGNYITDGGVKFLCDALKSDNTKLTELDVWSNNVGDNGAMHLSDALKSKSCKLTKLHVSHNKLTDQGVEYLSEALKIESCELSVLHIRENILTCESAQYFSEALISENCKLTELDISYNNLHDEGAKYLCDALQNENCKLTRLFIRGNFVSKDGAKYFSDSSKSHKCIVYVD
ncbi:NACHT, LRR and PYD domains-containing protein 3-like [Xenia sp. Carnegie-2017]|uniref:NACHT, LRR and PYD domains-containing protein 3-like n=1 Tax=Xenia sp. Carnegie-2017 TaxID=2897299 RepID=UPI001F0453C8|nr:NACHT, LRR and PYD domains-containing protein 3-like [Xenia sp. Carnegie-2017]